MKSGEFLSSGRRNVSPIKMENQEHCALIISHVVLVHCNIMIVTYLLVTFLSSLHSSPFGQSLSEETVQI